MIISSVLQTQPEISCVNLWRPCEQHCVYQSNWKVMKVRRHSVALMWFAEHWSCDRTQAQLHCYCFTGVHLKVLTLSEGVTHTNLSAKFRAALVVLLDGYFSFSVFLPALPSMVSGASRIWALITVQQCWKLNLVIVVGRLSNVVRLSCWSKVTVTH